MRGQTAGSQPIPRRHLRRDAAHGGSNGDETDDGGSNRPRPFPGGGERLSDGERRKEICGSPVPNAEAEL